MTFRDVLNNIMNDYFIPLLAFVIIGAFTVSIIKNWDNISDGAGDGKRWAGFLGVAREAGYIAIIPVLLALAVKLILAIKITL